MTYFTAPRFWQKKDAFLSKALWPLSCIYSFATWIRGVFTCPYKHKRPVICVGNATLGGAGKTPTVLAVATLLKKMGRSPCALTKGYRGKEIGPICVDLSKHSAIDVGDEALLLAKHLETWVAQNRVQGLKNLVSAECILVDDGYQNPSFVKDLSLLVIDGPTGFGNGCVFPAGPLRSSLAINFSQADAVIVVGEIKDPVLKNQLKSLQVPVFYGHYVPRLSPETFFGKKWLAFSGIARPEKFFTTLRHSGLEVVKTASYPDHYLYKESEIENLLRLSEKKGLQLVTTEKDKVRIQAKYASMIDDFPITLQLVDEEGFFEFLQCKLNVFG